MTIVNQKFTLAEFEQYVANLSFVDWKPKGITIHHTWAPSLAQRPNGFNSQNMKDLRAWYMAPPRGWSSGPHLFVDDKAIWVFYPLTKKGTHARSFNSTHIGIEMLGNYDKEDPTTGRGAAVLNNARAASRILQTKLGLTNKNVNFHRDDKKTDKTCPGRRITKDLFFQINSKPMALVVGGLFLLSFFF